MSHPIRRRILALVMLGLAATTGLGVTATSGLASHPFAASTGASAPASALGQPEIRARPASTEAAPAFSGDEAHRHVRALSEQIGSRVAGTENQRRAAEYLAEQFRQLGYQTELQPFTITSYDDRGSAVQVGGVPGGDVSATTLQTTPVRDDWRIAPAPVRDVRATTLKYSAGGVVEAELVDGGLGRPDELATANPAGKIVLVERGELRFQEKVTNAARAGAAGILIYNHSPGSFTGRLAEASAIPAASISQAAGADLLDQVYAGPVSVRLSVDASMQTSTAQNVIATRAGGPETVVIGGHFDSISAGPGANDNASGTAVVLELARVMASQPTPFTLKFALFDAEEIGLLGSAYIVGQMSPEELSSIRAMINVDMVGVGTAPQLGGDESLARVGQRIAAELGEPAGLIGQVQGGSDHASFARVGVPALFIYRANDPNYHGPLDRAEYVDPENLAFAGRLALGVLDALANGR